MTKSSIQCEAGDVVLVRFPFTDQTQTKLRPAVVLSTSAYSKLHGDGVLLGLTTQPQTDQSLALSSWLKAGLPRQTCVKPVIVTLTTQLLVRRLGALEVADYQAVRAALGMMIAAPFLGKLHP